MSEQDDEDFADSEAGESEASWSQMPITKALGRRVLADARMKLSLLLAACDQSTDPKVQRAYGEYSRQRDFAEVFAKAERGKETGLRESLVVDKRAVE